MSPQGSNPLQILIKLKKVLTLLLLGFCEKPYRSAESVLHPAVIARVYSAVCVAHPPHPTLPRPVELIAISLQAITPCVLAGHGAGRGGAEPKVDRGPLRPARTCSPRCAVYFSDKRKRLGCISGASYVSDLTPPGPAQINCLTAGSPLPRGRGAGRQPPGDWAAACPHSELAPYTADLADTQKAASLNQREIYCNSTKECLRKYSVRQG